MQISLRKEKDAFNEEIIEHLPLSRTGRFLREWALLEKKGYLHYFNDEHLNELTSIVRNIRENEKRRTTNNTQIRSLNRNIRDIEKEMEPLIAKTKRSSARIRKVRRQLQQIRLELRQIDEELSEDLGLVEFRMKILRRHCVVSFRSVEDRDLFIEQQNANPQLLRPRLVYADVSNIRIPENRPREPKSNYSDWEVYRHYLERKKRFELKVNEAELGRGHMETEIRVSLEGHRFYAYAGDLYYFDDSDAHTPAEQEILIKEHVLRKRQKFKRLRKHIQLSEKMEAGLTQSREAIPEEIRFAVWRRDGGKCVRCGNKEKLEFDHIIPLSKGGSNTARNIQLLCENCNREKSNNI